MLIELGEIGKRQIAVLSTTLVLALLGFLAVNSPSCATGPGMSSGLVQELSCPGAFPTGILVRAPIVHYNLLLHHS